MLCLRKGGSLLSRLNQIPQQGTLFGGLLYLWVGSFFNNRTKRKICIARKKAVIEGSSTPLPWGSKINQYCVFSSAPFLCGCVFRTRGVGNLVVGIVLGNSNEAKQQWKEENQPTNGGIGLRKHRPNDSINLNHSGTTLIQDNAGNPPGTPL